MSDLFGWLFGAATFVPHGFCLAWRPDLVAMHALSDLAIAAAYFAIPGAIYLVARKRQDFGPEQRRIALLFVAFIIACGLTHLIGLVSLWSPIYGLQALVKAATAAVSVATALALWPLIPKFAALPTPQDLQLAVARLHEEVAAKNDALRALEAARDELEAKVAARTRELTDKARDLEVLNARFETAVAGSNVTMFEQDRDLRYTWIVNPAGGYANEEVIGKNDEDLIPESAAGLAQIKQTVIESATPRHVEVALRFSSGLRSFRTNFTPILDAKGGVQGVRALAIDTTELREAEERLRIMMREMAHRAKNLLAVVSALARQISRAEAASDVVASRLVERLQALARAQDVLVAGTWGAVDLGDIVREQLAPVVGADRIEISADASITLDSDQAQMVALAIHELATNALKHGALSTAAGTVALWWGREEDRVALRWTETGGPPVATPVRAGFGRQLLETLAPRALHGAADLAYAQTGVRYVLRFRDRGDGG